MHGLIGFRNTAIHNYKKLDLDIVEAIIVKHLGDFRELVKAAIQANQNWTIKYVGVNAY